MLIRQTLLYMLIQRSGTGTLPPPGFTTPPWEALKAQWDRIPAPSSSTVELGPTPLVMGHNDSEADDNLFESAKVETVRSHVFGWDNESPERIVNVEPFRAEWRPAVCSKLRRRINGRSSMISHRARTYVGRRWPDRSRTGCSVSDNNQTPRRELTQAKQTHNAAP